MSKNPEKKLVAPHDLGERKRKVAQKPPVVRVPKDTGGVPGAVPAKDVTGGGLYHTRSTGRWGGRPISKQTNGKTPPTVLVLNPILRKTVHELAAHWQTSVSEAVRRLLNPIVPNIRGALDHRSPSFKYPGDIQFNLGWPEKPIIEEWQKKEGDGEDQKE